MSLEMVKVKNLSFRFNKVEVLREVSFSLRQGDYLGLVGPNGSGKSTLLKIILNVLKPTTGEVELFGLPLASFRGWEKIGYLPQRTDSFTPYFPATVREVVGLGLRGKRSHEARNAVEEALAVVGVNDLRDKLVGDLSGGQKQRVLIARALVNKPELLILDEPTTALDPETRDSFFTLLNDLNQQKGVTIILVTHDLGSIGKYASRLLYLDIRPIFFGSFHDFCRSESMTSLFGASSQHIICQQHGERGLI